MRKTALAVFLASIGVGVFACSSSDPESTDAPDAAVDSSPPPKDQHDAQTPPAEDAQADATVDADADAGVDAAPDAAPPVLFALGSQGGVARRVDGSLVGWGYNVLGAVGDGTRTSRNAPVRVAGITNPVSLGHGASAQHQCVVLADNTVSCWGYSVYGATGPAVTDPGETAVTLPVAVPGVAGVTALADGSSFTCALLSDKTVSCWGHDSIGHVVDSATPVAIAGLADVTSIAGGDNEMCALLSTGTVQCWGWGVFGSLGDTNVATHSQATPAAVTGIAGATAICQGQFHGCAVVAGGTVKCWGDDASGQLGDGTTTNSGSAVDVASLTGVVDIACSGSSTCARTSAGRVWCWGYNGGGEMGNAAITTTTVAAPTMIPTLSNVTAIGMGQSFGCALSSNDLYCWGYDYDGELGTGDVDAGAACPDTDNFLPPCIVTPQKVKL